jgi:Orsellinic acid/F9775 biosynthesis cluster protein D
MSNQEAAIAKRYVTYLPEYAVLVCRKCKYALHTGRRLILEHFCTIHKVTTKAIRNSISKYAEKLLLNGVKDTMTPPNNTIDPIPELEIWKGLECNACGYVTKAQKTMMDHCYE